MWIWGLTPTPHPFSSLDETVGTLTWQDLMARCDREKLFKHLYQLFSSLFCDIITVIMATLWVMISVIYGVQLVTISLTHCQIVIDREKIHLALLWSFLQRRPNIKSNCFLSRLCTVSLADRWRQYSSYRPFIPQRDWNWMSESQIPPWPPTWPKLNVWVTDSALTSNVTETECLSHRFRPDLQRDRNWMSESQIPPWPPTWLKLNVWVTDSALTSNVTETECLSHRFRPHLQRDWNWMSESQIPPWPPTWLKLNVWVTDSALTSNVTETECLSHRFRPDPQRDWNWMSESQIPPSPPTWLKLNVWVTDSALTLNVTETECLSHRFRPHLQRDWNWMSASQIPPWPPTWLKLNVCVTDSALTSNVTETECLSHRFRLYKTYATSFICSLCKTWTRIIRSKIALLKSAVFSATLT